MDIQTIIKTLKKELDTNHIIFEEQKNTNHQNDKDNKKRNKILKKRTYKRQLEDGIYNITNIKHEYIEDVHAIIYNLTKSLDKISFKTQNQIIKFATKYPNQCIADTYEVNGAFLLSESPKEFKNDTIGSGLNYGTCSIIENCPTKLLFLAEND